MKSACFRSGPTAVQTAMTTAVDAAEERQREAVIVAVVLGDLRLEDAFFDISRLPS